MYIYLSNYVHISKFTHTDIYIHTYMLKHTCIFIQYTYVYIYVYISIYTYVYKYTYTYTYIYTYIYVCVYINFEAYIFTYINIHHIYIYIHIYTICIQVCTNLHTCLYIPMYTCAHMYITIEDVEIDSSHVLIWQVVFGLHFLPVKCRSAFVSKTNMQILQQRKGQGIQRDWREQQDWAGRCDKMGWLTIAASASITRYFLWCNPGVATLNTAQCPWINTQPDWPWRSDGLQLRWSLQHWQQIMQECQCV